LRRGEEDVVAIQGRCNYLPEETIGIVREVDGEGEFVRGPPEFILNALIKVIRAQLVLLREPAGDVVTIDDFLVDVDEAADM
jgi:hypothetical protein